jgi:hypothetical protein
VSHPARLYVALALAILLAGISLRAINLGGPAFCCDEFFDVFAARSWLARDGFEVPGREYTRALLMTRATAASFALFGEAEWSARLPALAFGVLALPLIFVAGRMLFGPAAALAALGLLAISPHGIDVSRFARLYSPLTLLLLGGALAVYVGLEGRRNAGPELRISRALWLLAGGLAILAGSHFHPVALALGPAIQLYAGVRAVQASVRGERRQAALYALVFAALTLCEAIVAAVPELRQKLTTAALVPLPWYRPRPGDSWVHVEHLQSIYGWLWYLVVVSTAAVLFAGRSGLFVALSFWVPFIAISSGVATKHHRYTIQLLPFAWLIVGGAAEVAWARLSRRADASRLRQLDRPWWLTTRRGQVSAVAAWTALAVSALIGLLAVAKITPSVPEALRRPFRSEGTFTVGSFYDWRGLAQALDGRIDPGAIVVSDRWHEVIYYLDRQADQLLPAYRVWGAGDWETPERDYSSKVQGAEHLQRRLERQPVWLIVSAGQWRRDGFYDSGLQALVEQACRKVELPGRTGFVAAFDCGGQRVHLPPDASAVAPRLVLPLTTNAPTGWFDKRLVW